MRNFTYSLVISLCCLTSAAFAQGRDLTVLMNSDTHFGFSGSITQNRINIQAMNGMEGKAYPASIGGTVGIPRGVTVAGDLTDGARYGERDDYLDHYPLNGGTGVNEIHYPVKELTGNHDRREPWYYFGATPVRDAVEARQGALRYSWDWQGVHFASLDIYPYESHCDWLANDLAAIAPETPVVILSHYGYTSWDQGSWDDWSYQSQYFKNTINGYNVVALVHGHSHNSVHYTWEGYDVYSPGSPKEADNNSFGVLNIQDRKLTWAEYGYEADGSGDWTWTHEKAVATRSGYSTDFEAPTFTGGGVIINGQDEWSKILGYVADTAVDSSLVGSGQAAIIRYTTDHSARISHNINDVRQLVTEDFVASFDLGFNNADTMEQAWVGFMKDDSFWNGAEVGIRQDGSVMKLAYKTGGSWVFGAEIFKDKYYHYEVAVNLSSMTYDVLVYDGQTELMNVTGITLTLDGDTSLKKVVFHACSWTGSAGVAYLDNLDIDIVYTENVNMVPEPATLTLLALGSIAMMIRRKK